MNTRFYSFRIVTYATPDEFQPLLDFSTKYEYILHDKDLDDSGVLKIPHYHINVVLPVWKSVKAVCSFVKSTQNTFAIPMDDKRKAHEYLTHSNDPDKFQYSVADIVTSSQKQFFKDDNASADMEDFLTVLLDNSLTYRERAYRLGRDYVRNFRRYHDFANLVHRQERDLVLGYPDDCILYDMFHFQVDYLTKVLEPLLRSMGLTDLEIARFELDYFK